MPEAWELDRLLHLCKSHGMYMTLGLEVHNMFRGINHYNPGNEMSTFRGNPYYSGNQDYDGNQDKIPGLINSRDFFNSSAAKEQYKKRLRYISARWGWSTTIMAYEVFTEIDQVSRLTDDLLPAFDEDNPNANPIIEFSDEGAMRDAITGWVLEMAAYIKNDLEDPHLLTASYAEGIWDCPGNVTWCHGDLRVLKLGAQLGWLDFVGFKGYTNRRNGNLIDNWDNADGILTDITNQPFLIVEGGSGQNGGQSLDACNPPTHFHNAIWATSFQGGLGCMQDWWWEKAILHNGHEDQFTALNHFMNNSGIDYDGDNYTPQRYPHTNPVPNRYDNSIPLFEAFSLVSEDQNRAIGWVHNRTNYWFNFLPSNSCLNNLFVSNIVDKPPDEDDSYPSPQNLAGETFDIKQLKALTKYRIEWYRTSDGSFWFSTTRTSGISGGLQVTVPNMSAPNGHDFAFKIYDDDIGSFRTHQQQPTKEYGKVPVPNAGKEGNNKGGFVIYPNPAKDICMIFCENCNQNFDLSIYNTIGEKVYEENNIPSSSFQFNVSRLSSGIYIIKVHRGDSYSIGKMIKE